MYMSDRDRLEDFKKKVEDCLKLNYKHSDQERERLMKLYEDDFQKFLSDNWEPILVATATVYSY